MKDLKIGSELKYKGGNVFLDKFLTKGEIYAIQDYFSELDYIIYELEDDDYQAGESLETLAISDERLKYFELVKE